MDNIHILISPTMRKLIYADKCPDCNKRSRFIRFCYEWYGPSDTCLKCGRQWNDGEWMPLDFVRGSRKKNIDSAKAHWRMTAKQGSDGK